MALLLLLAVAAAAAATPCPDGAWPTACGACAGELALDGADAVGALWEMSPALSPPGPAGSLVAALVAARWDGGPPPAVFAETAAATGNASVAAGGEARAHTPLLCVAAAQRTEAAAARGGGAVCSAAADARAAPEGGCASAPALGAAAPLQSTYDTCLGLRWRGGGGAAAHAVLSNGPLPEAVSAAPLAAGRWHHLAATWENADGLRVAAGTTVAHARLWALEPAAGGAWNASELAAAPVTFNAQFLRLAQPDAHLHQPSGPEADRTARTLLLERPDAGHAASDRYAAWPRALPLAGGRVAAALVARRSSAYEAQPVAEALAEIAHAAFGRGEATACARCCAHGAGARAAGAGASLPPAWQQGPALAAWWFPRGPAPPPEVGGGGADPHGQCRPVRAAAGAAPRCPGPGSALGPLPADGARCGGPLGTLSAAECAEPQTADTLCGARALPPGGEAGGLPCGAAARSPCAHRGDAAGAACLCDPGAVPPRCASALARPLALLAGGALALPGALQPFPAGAAGGDGTRFAVERGGGGGGGGGGGAAATALLVNVTLGTGDLILWAPPGAAPGVAALRVRALAGQRQPGRRARWADAATALDVRVLAPCDSANAAWQVSVSVALPPAVPAGTPLVPLGRPLVGIRVAGVDNRTLALGLALGCSAVTTAGEVAPCAFTGRPAAAGAAADAERLGAALPPAAAVVLAGDAPRLLAEQLAALRLWVPACPSNASATLAECCAAGAAPLRRVFLHASVRCTAPDWAPPSAPGTYRSTSLTVDEALWRCPDPPAASTTAPPAATTAPPSASSGGATSEPAAMSSSGGGSSSSSSSGGAGATTAPATGGSSGGATSGGAATSGPGLAHRAAAGGDAHAGELALEYGPESRMHVFAFGIGATVLAGCLALALVARVLRRRRAKRAAYRGTETERLSGAADIHYDRMGAEGQAERAERESDDVAADGLDATAAPPFMSGLGWFDRALARVGMTSARRASEGDGRTSVYVSSRRPRAAPRRRGPGTVDAIAGPLYDVALERPGGGGPAEAPPLPPPPPPQRRRTLSQRLTAVWQGIMDLRLPEAELDSDGDDPGMTASSGDLGAAAGDAAGAGVGAHYDPFARGPSVEMSEAERRRSDAAYPDALDRLEMGVVLPG